MKKYERKLVNQVEEINEVLEDDDLDLDLDLYDEEIDVTNIINWDVEDDSDPFNDDEYADQDDEEDAGDESIGQDDEEDADDEYTDQDDEEDADDECVDHDDEEDAGDDSIGQDDDFDLSCFKASSSSVKSLKPRSSGGLTIVNSRKNGVRISLTKKNWELLGKANVLEFGLGEQELLVGSDLYLNTGRHNVKEQAGRPVIYNSSLVQELVEHYSLDYSGGRTSHSFSVSKQVTIKGKPALVFKMM